MAKGEKIHAESPELRMETKARSYPFNNPEVQARAKARSADSHATRRREIVDATIAIMRVNQWASKAELVKEMNAKDVVRPFNVKKWTLANFEPYFNEAYAILTNPGSVQSVALAAE